MRAAGFTACKIGAVDNIVRMLGTWGLGCFGCGGEISWLTRLANWVLAAALGTLLLAGGISGCSSMSTDHVDCNVVKLQQQSGRSDAEIASAIGGQ